MEGKLGGKNKDNPKKNTVANMVDIYPVVPIITSNVIPVKRQRLPLEWIKKVPSHV